MRRPAVIALVLFASTLVVPPSAQSAEPDGTKQLRDAVTVDGIRQHLEKFQQIADKYGNRSAGTPGYDASADYVADTLKKAGYKVRLQSFDWLAFRQDAPATLTQVGGSAPVAYDVSTLLYSGSGSAEGTVVAATDDANSGCAATDLGTASASAAQIALVGPGGCSLAVKIGNAAAAGYGAMIVVAEDGVSTAALPDGSLTELAAIPVVGVTHAVGAGLLGGATTVRVETRTSTELRTAANVLGTSKWGDKKNTLVVGSHLDSVLAGPGINDNGSGSAMDLEIARQIAKLGIKTDGRLRFAFWAAEEYGLVGSRYYVTHLTEKKRKKIAANLNFDMVASPNYVRFVYDGDGSTGGPVGPPGSAKIEHIFTDYFKSQDLASAPTPFNGRSDYGPFIGVGIPAGGLFTGAEGRKTEEEAKIYGGKAGEPYDSCYHQSCDTIDNIKDKALDEMSDAAAHTTLVVANLK